MKITKPMKITLSVIAAQIIAMCCVSGLTHIILSIITLITTGVFAFQLEKNERAEQHH